MVRGAKRASMPPCTLRANPNNRMLVGPADIPLPEGLVPPLEETEDLREGLQSQGKHTAQWQELGLNTIH